MSTGVTGATGTSDGHDGRNGCDGRDRRDRGEMKPKDEKLEERLKALELNFRLLSKKLNVIIGVPNSDPGSSQYNAKVFINGDAMTKTALTWLCNLVVKKQRVQIFKAFHPDNTSGKDSWTGELSQIPGVQPNDVNVMVAAKKSKNCTDILLSELYDKHAGSMNYILSDKQWFRELPHADPDKRTVWLKFNELDLMSKPIPEIFVEFMQKERTKALKAMKGLSTAPARQQLRTIYNGRPFQDYLKNVKKNVTHFERMREEQLSIAMTRKML